MKVVLPAPFGPARVGVDATYCELWLSTETASAIE